MWYVEIYAEINIIRGIIRGNLYGDVRGDLHGDVYGHLPEAPQRRKTASYFSRRRIRACSAESEHAASNRDTKFGHVAPDLPCNAEFFATRKCSAESVPALDLPKCSAEPRRRTSPGTCSAEFAAPNF